MLSAVILAACSGQPRPAETSIPTAAPTVTLDPLAVTRPPSSNGYITYHNLTYRFSFDYPAIYDDPNFKSACGVKDLGSSITLGARIRVDVLQAGNLSLDDFTNQYLTGKDWMRGNQDIGSIAGARAINVAYQSVSTGQYGTVTFVKHDPVVLSIGYTSGPFCANLGADADESAAYQHVLDTFQFTK